MTRMPDISGELGPVEGFAHRAEHEFADTMRRLTHPHLFHHDVPQPAAAPAPTIPVSPAVPATQTSPEGTTTMSLLAVYDKAKSIATELEEVDRDVLTHIEAILASPELAPLIPVIGAIARAELPEGMIAAASAGFQVLAKVAESAPSRQLPQAIADAAAAQQDGTV